MNICSSVSVPSAGCCDAWRTKPATPGKLCNYPWIHTHTWFIFSSFFFTHSEKRNFLPSLMSQHKSHKRFPRARGENSRGKSCWLSWFTFSSLLFFVLLFLLVTPSHTVSGTTVHREPSFLFGRPTKKKYADNFFVLFKREGMLVLLGPAPFSSQSPKKESRRSHTTNRTPLVFRELLAPLIQKSSRALPFTLITSFPDFLLEGR